jgi:hypothetical protein
MPSLNTKLATAPNTTSNYVLRATSSTTIGNSTIQDDGTNVAIGTTPGTYKLNVSGTGNFTGALTGTSATFSGIVQMATGSQVMSSGLLKLGIASGNAGAAFQLLGWSSGTNWQIDTAYIGNGFNITPSTTSGGTTFTTPAFSISNTANIGIGTITPSNILTIKNSTSNTQGIDFQNYASSGVLGQIIYNQADDTFNIVNTSAYAAGGIVFKTNSAEKVRISTNGRVQITTNGSYAAAQNFQLTINAGSGSSGIQLTNAQGSYCYLVNDGTYFIIGSDAGSTGNKVLISRNAPDNAMTITSAGAVLVNTSSVGGKMYVYNPSTDWAANTIKGHDANTNSNTDGIISVVANRNSNNASFYAYGYYNAGAGAFRFFVSDSGQVNSTSTSIAAISDIRHKENIRPIETGLVEIMKLKPSRFDWKEGKGTGRKDVAGFIAQELEEILPDLVDEWKEKKDDIESFKSIRMGDLIPTLVKAIQEQQAQIEAQQQQINSLINR